MGFSIWCNFILNTPESGWAGGDDPNLLRTALRLRFAWTGHVGERRDGLQDAAEVHERHAVAVEEIAEGELALEAFVAVLAHFVGQPADEVEVGTFQHRHGDATAVWQIGEFVLPALEPGPFPGLALGFGERIECLLVGLHQVELLALQVDKLAEQIRGIRGRARQARRNDTRYVKLALHGRLNSWRGEAASHPFITGNVGREKKIRK